MNTQYTNFLKTLAICLALMLAVGYILFSYNLAYKLALNQNKALLLAEKEEITSALHKYNHYLNLLESRLLHSLHKEETILRILREKIEPVMDTTFPKVMSLEFIPAYNPNIIFTRVGVTTTKEATKSKDLKKGIIYLGKGLFKVTKPLYNEKKKPFGTLKTTFSISHLLYKHFSKNEIHVLSENERPLENNLLTFEITGLPYLFVIDRVPPSFWQFILSAKLKIICVLSLVIAVLVIGIAVGSFLNQKRLLQQRALNKRFKEKLKVSERENTKVSSQLITFENLLKLKARATKVKNEIFIAVYERYRQMAAQAQSINLLTSKLILEEAGNDKLLKEIHSISQEGTTVLRQLVDGFLMKEKMEEINVIKSIEKIKELFLPELIERNIQFSIKGKIKKPLQSDQVILEIALHNIFHMVIERLLKDNIFQVEIEDRDPFQIIFYDNGYDIEEKLHKVKGHPKPDNILWLDKMKLKEFITHLGWEISFLKDKQLLNSIKLSIPRVLTAKELPDNVINLFDYKPYAQ